MTDAQPTTRRVSRIWRDEAREQEILVQFSIGVDAEEPQFYLVTTRPTFGALRAWGPPLMRSAEE